MKYIQCKGSQLSVRRNRERAKKHFRTFSRIRRVRSICEWDHSQLILHMSERRIESRELQARKPKNFSKLTSASGVGQATYQARHEEFILPPAQHPLKMEDGRDFSSITTRREVQTVQMGMSWTVIKRLTLEDRREAERQREVRDYAGPKVGNASLLEIGMMSNLPNLMVTMKGFSIWVLEPAKQAVKGTFQQHFHCMMRTTGENSLTILFLSIFQAAHCARGTPDIGESSKEKVANFVDVGCMGLESMMSCQVSSSPRLVHGDS